MYCDFIDHKFNKQEVGVLPVSQELLYQKAIKVATDHHSFLTLHHPKMNAWIRFSFLVMSCLMILSVVVESAMLNCLESCADKTGFASFWCESGCSLFNEAGE